MTDKLNFLGPRPEIHNRIFINDFHQDKRIVFLSNDVVAQLAAGILLKELTMRAYNLNEVMNQKTYDKLKDRMAKHAYAEIQGSSIRVAEELKGKIGNKLEGFEATIKTKDASGNSKVEKIVDAHVEATIKKDEVKDILQAIETAAKGSASIQTKEQPQRSVAREVKLEKTEFKESKPVQKSEKHSRKGSSKGSQAHQMAQQASIDQMRRQDRIQEEKSRKRAEEATAEKKRRREEDVEDYQQTVEIREEQVKKRKNFG